MLYLQYQNKSKICQNMQFVDITKYENTML